MAVIWGHYPLQLIGKYIRHQLVMEPFFEVFRIDFHYGNYQLPSCFEIQGLCH